MFIDIKKPRRKSNAVKSLLRHHFSTADNTSAQLVNLGGSSLDVHRATTSISNDVDRNKRIFLQRENVGGA